MRTNDLPRIMFMGTPDFAVKALDALLTAGYPIVGVVTQPDRPRGRGYVMTPPAVKVYAEEHGLKIYQPQSLRDGAGAELVSVIEPDIAVVAAYGKILPSEVLNYPRLGCVNIHGSLLPLYRGADPIRRAIIDGRSETGVTTMMMDEGMDTGDMLMKKSTPIYDSDDFGTLYDRLAGIGAELILETITALLAGTLKRLPQPGESATFAPKCSRDELCVDFSKSAREVYNLIRGLAPAPMAYTVLHGKMLKIISADLPGHSGKNEPGTVASVAGGRISVVCGDGNTIALTAVIPEGRGRMPASAFINGRGIAEGDMLGGSN